MVPDIQIQRLQAMFTAASWQVTTLKWGRLINDLFERPGGAELRNRLEQMPNEEYQRLLRADSSQVASRLTAGGGSADLQNLLQSMPAPELAAAVRDLGGHDLGLLVDTFSNAATDRPTVVFAYTVKGRGLPTEGHPNNHSALLTEPQIQALAAASQVPRDAPWQPFDPDTPAGRLCSRRRSALQRAALPEPAALSVPASLGRSYRSPISTQAALGRLLADLSRDAPTVAARVVTCSPDVASSTNLGGWINKTGVWSVEDRYDWFADDADRVLRWSEVSSGQHIELGIAEVNLVCLLGELGATWSRWGQRLIPIATLYDPFVSRALEPWSYGIYAGGQSILIGTPSGVTLAPEGGAHQSIITPSIGLEQPGCTAWEPAFAQDLEWCLLQAMDHVGVPGGTSAYFRLSTRPVDPTLAGVPQDQLLAERRRQQAVAGGYRLDAPHPPRPRGRHAGRGRRGHARGDRRRRRARGRRCQRRRRVPDQPGPGVPVLPAPTPQRCSGQLHSGRAVPGRYPHAAGDRARRPPAHAVLPRRRPRRPDPLPRGHRVRSVLRPHRRPTSCTTSTSGPSPARRWRSWNRDPPAGSGERSPHASAALAAAAISRTAGRRLAGSSTPSADHRTLESGSSHLSGVLDRW